MRNIWVAAITFLLVPLASAGTVYKCKNQDGALLYQETPCPTEVQSVSSWKSHGQGAEIESDSSSGNGTLVIGQGQGGHYYIDGAINDHFLNFVVDTGATLVTIPLGLASSAGLRCQGQAMMQTGNGTSSVCLTTIQKMTFGGFTLRNVDAVVAPNLNQPLLGMNVLKRFRVEQDGGQMRLSKKY